MKRISTKSKATPKSGYKMPKLDEGEEIIGFKPYGSNDISSKPRNFNMAL
jgi:hypothetical protein